VALLGVFDVTKESSKNYLKMAENEYFLHLRLLVKKSYSSLFAENVRLLTVPIESL